MLSCWARALCLLGLEFAAANNSAGSAVARLVESMPTGMEDLNASVQLHTHTAVIGLLDGATKTVDIAAMYWSLLPSSCGANITAAVHRSNSSKPGSHDAPHTAPDCSGFAPARLDSLLAGRGALVLDALRRAAARGVALRVLQSAGFPSEAQGGVPNAESAALAAEFPGLVKVRTLNMSAWYGNGIQHAKFLVADRASLLLGSSNFCDWRSLSQVKELGILVTTGSDHETAAAPLARDLTAFFDDAWAVAARNPADGMLLPYDDPLALRTRYIPCWSPLLHGTAGSDCASPLPPSNPATRDTPLLLPLNGDRASLAFLSCAPPAFCGGGGGGGNSNSSSSALSMAGNSISTAPRTSDESTLVRTITDARQRISIAVMDFLPSSMSLWAAPGDAPIYWPALVSALLSVVSARAVQARIMVSEWAWSDPTMIPYLRALQQTAAVCRGSGGDGGGDGTATCAGSLEVRKFSVPGWNDTMIEGQRRFPGHSRVNHNKYIVSETTANIATSNMAWSYFYTTVGTSLNVRSPALAAQLTAVFDRDWVSQYSSSI